MSVENADAILSASVVAAVSIITTLITIRHERIKAREQREHDRQLELERKKLEMQLELNRKALELKNKTIVDISEAVMGIIAPIMRVEILNGSYSFDDEGEIQEPSGIQDLKRARDEEYYNNFIIRSHVIQSNIQTYFSRCLRQWNVLMDLIPFLVGLSDNWEFDDRARFIQNHSVENDRNLSEFGEMAEGEDNTPVFHTLLEAATARFNRRNQARDQIDADRFTEIVADRNILAWHDLKNAITDRKDELARAIINEQIPFFQLDK